MNPTGQQIITRLKGGSLSGTYLIEEEGRKRVRKDISLSENREYGYIRWHSQLKRLQRFGELFPGVFPKVLDVGLSDAHAYFDLEYIEGSISGYSFLAANPSPEKVQEFFAALVQCMDRLHGVRRSSCAKALDLYIYEEMERPLMICSQDQNFQEFLKHEFILFNGLQVPSIIHQLPLFYELAHKHYQEAWECYTHGNLTLENTLWTPDQKRIWFIDPYEENIADTVYNEYSQILQSCDGRYEAYNEMEPHVEGHSVTLRAPIQPGITQFDALFQAFQRERLSKDELVLVQLYEVSQFTRMLPFKLHVARDKMIFFYALASYLTHRMLSEIHG